MCKLKVKYETTDNKTFEDKKEATEHQQVLECRKLTEGLLAIPLEKESGMLIDWIKKNRKFVIGVLKLKERFICLDCVHFYLGTSTCRHTLTPTLGNTCNTFEEKENND